MLKLLFVLYLFVTIFSCGAFDDVKTVDVIAIEYPPFTTINQSNGGIAFELLNKVKLTGNLKWKPIFLPPKRAFKKIESGDWCASFYPAFGNNEFTQYQLSDEVIKIGLLRRSQAKPFAWSSLDELSGMSVVLLRTGTNSYFENRFIRAGLEIVYVETINAAVQMVLLQRVDTAIIDNVSYNNLEAKNREQIQISQSFLIETKINISINTNCGISLAELKVMKSQN